MERHTDSNLRFVVDVYRATKQRSAIALISVKGQEGWHRSKAIMSRNKNEWCAVCDGLRGMGRTQMEAAIDLAEKCRAELQYMIA
jgi:hypothetical protein